ncbi:TIGR03435 family protein [Granulicella arctica]|uniref:Uncharacterized protein (TIGR03435 family) n=1 Tax=Granulicella arctica TaxID=940613 RepID=A0A7Y9TGQ8_9BACT|nr:TIGR03435 family protein [Granulicella arctica]NYF79030.1 uncharacterized protein (TIGR03435 family) [Granulicella arctica]
MALAQQRFQIATIKPSAPNTSKHTQSRGTKFATTGTTVEDLLKFAYNVHVSQIVGGPSWARTDQFDVLADLEMDRRPSLDELKAMTADLLFDRFHLVLGRERRELPVFALVRAKDALKLKPASSDPSSILSGALTPPGSLYVHGGTLTDFAAYLQRYAPPEINRPVVDQTGIPGRFEFELHFTPDSSQTEGQSIASPSDAIPPPEIFSAIQDQLGLKLRATKAEVDVLNIISITPPTPN